jgi:hypothetical protein
MVSASAVAAPRVLARHIHLRFMRSSLGDVKIRFMFFLMLIASQTLATEPRLNTREKTAFENALEQNQFVQTEERIVDLDGRRYREVSYQNKKYYYRFMEPEASLEVDCSMDSKLTPSLTEVGVTVYKRSKVFVQLLRETCLQMPGGRTRRVIAIDPHLGITIPDDPKSAIKNKKIYIGPTGPGFFGEW